MSSLLLEYFNLLDEARRDPNLKGMGNLNSLDAGLKRLLLTQVDRYYKFSYKDPKRSTLQAGFGTGSQLKALPGIAATTTPYKMLDLFKTTKEIKALIIEVAGQQVGLLFKQSDSKTHVTTFSFGISSKIREMAAKDISETDVVRHAMKQKADTINYINNNKKYDTPEENARKMKEVNEPASHAKQLVNSRERLEAEALEKLTKASFKSGRNTISGYDLSKGAIVGQSKQRTAEWISHLIEFVRLELGNKEAEVKYIGITADPEREALHKERKEQRAGSIPRDEENLYVKKAFKRSQFDAIKDRTYVPPAYKKYMNELKQTLIDRADKLRTKKANEEAVTIDSASDLHKLILAGKFHDKFKLTVGGKQFVYNFYDERNLRFNKLIAAQKGEKMWESDLPYIEFHVAEKGEELWNIKKAYRDKAREIEAQVEAKELTKEEGEHRIQTLDRELADMTPPSKIMFFLKLQGLGLTVHEIGLQQSGSWSSNRSEMIMYKVKYNDKGTIEGLDLMSKSEAAAAT